MGQRRAGCSGLGTRQAASRRLERLLVRRASVPLVPARALTGRSDDVSAQIDLIGVPLLMISEEPSAAPNGGLARGYHGRRVAGSAAIPFPFTTREE
jgi:hypothetical protein